jgi:hypothetical protein
LRHCREEKARHGDCPPGRNAYCGDPKSTPKTSPEGAAMNHPEIIKLQKFLQRTFNNRNIDVRPRAKLNDSVEVFVGEESIGLIHVDDEDGDKSYMFSMSILDIDLDDID